MFRLPHSPTFVSGFEKMSDQQWLRYFFQRGGCWTAAPSCPSSRSDWRRAIGEYDSLKNCELTSATVYLFSRRSQIITVCWTCALRRAARVSRCCSRDYRVSLSFCLTLTYCRPGNYNRISGKLICNDAKMARLGQLRRALATYIPSEDESGMAEKYAFFLS